MTKKLVLHVGTPKTGTSAIQKLLAANKKALAAHGMCYPLFKVTWPAVSHERNGQFLYQKTMHAAGYPKANGVHPVEMADKAFEKFKRVVQEGPCDTVILSEETLWQMLSRRKGALAALKQICDELGFEEYQVIVYLRRQDLFLESAWNQNVKAVRDYSKTYKEFLQGNYASRTSAYDDDLRIIEDVFGRESVTARVYDRAQLVNGDSAADFLDCLGLDINDGFELIEAEKNSSIKGNGFIELKRQLNTLPSYGKDGNFMAEAFKVASAGVPDVEPGGMMGAQERADMLATYEEGNRAIAQRYFGRDELFGPQKVDALEEWTAQPDELTRDVMMVLVEALIEEREHRKKLRARIDELTERVEYLERVNRNSLGLKLERKLRGSKMSR